MSKNLTINVLLSAVDKLTTPFRNASKRAQDLSLSLRKNNKLLRELKQSQERVKNTGLASAQERLKSKINQTTKSIEQQKHALERLNTVKRRQQNYQNNVAALKSGSERLQNFGQRSMTTGLAITAPVIASGRGVAAMTQTAGKFEQLRSVLEVTEGSSEKAKKSLEWVKQFAVDTPANVDEAAEAFVRLRAYGLDPTNGLLMSLGDTAAAMGKPVMQAVEAIADAVTGENERLKEFGIKGTAIKGSNIIEYAYTDKQGKQRVAKVDKTNRKQIEDTLKNIFNEKYAGAMEKQSKTLLGIWSKLEDVWTAFQLKIMESGAFDWIKNKLQGLLDTFDQMDKNGELQKWANDIGTVIMEVSQGLWAFGEKVVEVIKVVANFTRENKGVIASIVKWAAIIGPTLTVLGGLSMIASYAIYPVARLGLGLLRLSGISRLFSFILKDNDGNFRKLNKSLFSGKTTLQGLSNTGNTTIKKFTHLGGVIKALPSSFLMLLGKMRTVSFWLNGLKMIGRILLSPFRLLVGALGLLISPVGLVITAITAGAMLIYKYWDQVKAFFGGFFEGLKSGLAPVIEKFKPLGAAFGVVVDWIKKAVKWVTDLISPVETSQKNLESAASAGKKFGEWLAAGIDLVTKPLQWLMDSIQWVIDKMPSLTDNAEKLAPPNAQQIERMATMGHNMDDPNYIPPTPPKLENKWIGGLVGNGKGFAQGGYTGNGGKYDPAGIVHRGEYVMTKAATSRLGVPLLNALNYSKNALLATGLGVSVATAAPVQVDNRPPLKQSQPQILASQPMQVTINVNATAGQDANAIAKEVARQLAQLQNQQQIKNRSSLWDRD